MKVILTLRSSSVGTDLKTSLIDFYNRIGNDYDIE